LRNQFQRIWLSGVIKPPRSLLPSGPFPLLGGHQAENSVTRWSPSFATQTWVPPGAMHRGGRTRTSPEDDPDEAAGRGRELGDRLPEEFATQTWVPSDVTAMEPLNPNRVL